MTAQVVWLGTQQESLDLVNAVARNCSCEFGMMGVRIAVCAPHRMLVEDQRALNGLLFVRRMNDRFRDAEFVAQTETAATSAAVEDIMNDTEEVAPPAHLPKAYQPRDERKPARLSSPW